MEPATLRVLIACHNRRELTLRAITTAWESARVAGRNVHFYVCDDGSTDGTAEAILQSGAPIHLVRADGNAFWAKGMAIAESVAVADLGDRDWLVWLNDDVVLDADAFARAAIVEEHPNSIVVGSFRDPLTAEVTYGGYRLRHAKWHPLSTEAVRPGNVPQRIDTFNGNFVAIGVSAFREIGGIDSGFAHAGADIDYGLRARSVGVPVYLLPGTLGTCAGHPNTTGTAIEDWHHYRSRVGYGNPATLGRLLRKHSPLAWPALLLASHILWWSRRLLRNPFRKRSAGTH